jgi:TolB protein
VLPVFGAVHSEGQHGRVFFYSNGFIELIAPGGPVTISVVHGFETAELVQEVVVRAKATTQVDLALERIWDASENGWFSGDNHFHLNYGGTYRLTPGDLVLPMQGEALDIAYPLLANLHNRFLEQELWGWSSVGGPIIQFGQEVRSHFLGHVELIGADALFWPWVWGPGYQVYGDDDRTNAEALRFARENGGLGGYVHPVAVTDPFTPETYGQVPIGFVADAVLGEVDLIEVACLWTDNVGTAALWHSVLNLGIPLAASAGSDVMMDYYRTMAVGATRVYVKPEGEFNTSSYLEALKNGRSFVSNGPMLEFLVDGNEPGGVVSPGQTEAPVVPTETPEVEIKVQVDWTLNVHSPLPFDSVEIIVNGELVETQLGSPAAGSNRYSGSLEIPEGGWVTARVLGPDGGWPSMDSYLYAETSPVWFGRVGSTDPEAARRAAQTLLSVLDVAEERLIAGYGNTPIPNLLGHFQQARIRLEEMAAR